ncbi:MAG: hypothetical protein H7831_13575 [Magnetococcus sp. WYHC-3]
MATGQASAAVVALEGEWQCHADRVRRGQPDNRMLRIQSAGDNFQLNVASGDRTQGRLSGGDHLTTSPWVLGRQATLGINVDGRFVGRQEALERFRVPEGTAWNHLRWDGGEVCVRLGALSAPATDAQDGKAVLGTGSSGLGQMPAGVPQLTPPPAGASDSAGLAATHGGLLNSGSVAPGGSDIHNLAAQSLPGVLPKTGAVADAQSELPVVSDLPPLLRPGADLTTIINPEALAGGRPGGEVLVTKALMRVLNGPIPADQEALFNARYAADYVHPQPEVQARHRQLNRHLVDTIVQREIMARALEEREAARREAFISGLLGDLQSQSEARRKEQLQELTLQEVAREMERILAEAETTDTDPANTPATGNPAAAYSDALQSLRDAGSGPTQLPQARGAVGRWVFESTSSGKHLKPACPGCSDMKSMDSPYGIQEMDSVTHGPGGAQAVYTAGNARIRFQFTWASPPCRDSSVWQVGGCR